MVVSLSFFIVLITILFPGLIFRRLYYYGEFSKQFNAGHNLISLLALSIVPGIINLLLVYFFYDYVITNIDLGEIIDKFKDVNNPSFRLKQSEDTPIKELINNQISPFIGFLYTSCFISGILLGRFVRITGLDTKIKILRFKNYWFYLFNGHCTGFKKMKYLKESNKKHLFTKADILIDSNSKTHLYSGIVVDYELRGSDCKALSKIMLQNAERYSMRDGIRTAVSIPGNLFVVDCSSLKNINLTFIYEESRSILKSKFPNYVEIVFGIAIILLIPIFIFKAERISWEHYQNYFNLKWYGKITAYLLFVQLLSLFNPFIRQGNDYKHLTIKTFMPNLPWLFSLHFCYGYLSR